MTLSPELPYGSRIDFDIPILVVEDDRFPAEMLVRSLRGAGYTDIRLEGSGPRALEVHAAEPASIILASWVMPEMDGLAFCGHIRQRDAELHRYTYVILITGEDTPEALKHAFENGVDDFITKASIRDELLPRILASGRVAGMQQHYEAQFARLQGELERLRRDNVIDAGTGLGNRRYAGRRLASTLEHVGRRGGFACYMAIGIGNWDELCHRNAAPLRREIIDGVLRRLKCLTRPLDALARIEASEFAVIAHMEGDHEEHPFSLRRIHDAINGTRILTRAGYVDVEVGASMIACSQDCLGPCEEIMAVAHANLAKSFRTDSFEARYWAEVSRV